MANLSGCRTQSHQAGLCISSRGYHAVGVGSPGAQAPDEAKIPEVITRQLDAMHRDDAAAAFAIASPAIQSIFQDAPTFMRMVQLGFPQLYRSRNHRFLKLDTSDGRLIERVLIESDVGTVVARYELVEIDGLWRINGCIL
jgi:Domain of unknown function (DUF4864)